MVSVTFHYTAHHRDVQRAFYKQRNNGNMQHCGFWWLTLGKICWNNKSWVKFWTHLLQVRTNHQMRQHFFFIPCLSLEFCKRKAILVGRSSRVRVALYKFWLVWNPTLCSASLGCNDRLFGWMSKNVLVLSCSLFSQWKTFMMIVNMTIKCSMAFVMT